MSSRDQRSTVWSLGQATGTRRFEVGITTTQGRLSAVVAEPDEARGWVVFAAGEQSDLAEAMQASHALDRLALGTLTLDLSGAQTSAAKTDAVLDARSWLQANVAGSLPIGLGAAGSAVTTVLRAARHHTHDTPAILLWNGLFEPGTDTLRSSVPTLLLLDRDRSRGDRRAQRRIARKLGPSSELVLAKNLGQNADRVIRDWYEQAIARGENPARLAEPVRMHARRAAFGLVAAVSVAVPLAATAGAAIGVQHTARPISHGKLVASHQIAGDGFGAAFSPGVGAKLAKHKVSTFDPPLKAKRTHGGFTGKRIRAALVHGDGLAPPALLSTGSGGLTDGSGVKYFVNTNITFSTTSSASGAMSEASFTNNHADVSTLNGGVTTDQLNDAFDGYNTMAVHVGAGAPSGPVATGDPAYTIYNKNGVPSTSCLGRSIDFNAQNVSGLSMSRKVYVPTTGTFARWLNLFTNTTGAPMSVTMYTANNLGSDSNTVITGSSSGDTTAGLGDNWVSTFQNWSGTTSTDPRLGHVLQGPGATTPLSLVHFQDGDDNPYWGYTFTLAPGQTKAIANYVVVATNKAAAANGAAAIVAAPPTACLSATEQSEIVNFALGGSAGHVEFRRADGVLRGRRRPEPAHRGPDPCRNLPRSGRRPDGDRPRLRRRHACELSAGHRNHVRCRSRGLHGHRGKGGIHGSRRPRRLHLLREDELSTAQTAKALPGTPAP